MTFDDSECLSKIKIVCDLGRFFEGIYGHFHDKGGATSGFLYLCHGHTRTAYLYRCVWSGITGQ